jgi:hypothetical protein
MVFNQDGNKVFKTVKCKLTNKVVGRVECVLKSSSRNNVRNLLVSLQTQVAKLMPHAKRPSLCLLLFANNISLTSPNFVFSPRVSRREARTAFEALSVSACIEAMWNEDDSQVLKHVSSKGYYAPPYEWDTTLEIQGASLNQAVIPELKVFAWRNKICSLHVSLSGQTRLGDTSIFPDLTKLSLQRRGEFVDIPELSTQSTQDLMHSSRLETICTAFDISLQELSQLPRLSDLECMLTTQVQTNLGLMTNLVKLTLSCFQGSILELPACMSSLPNLEKLSILGLSIGGSIDAVCTLPKLRHLNLWETSCTGHLDDLLLLAHFETLFVRYGSKVQPPIDAFLDAGFRDIYNRMGGVYLTKRNN